MKDMLQVTQLKQKYKNEQVLVVPASVVDGVPDGFCQTISQTVSNIFKTSHSFVYRYDAEYNYSLMQLIPYVIVTNVTQNSLFITQRMRGEERLISALSLGCSGHVNPEDFSQDTVYKAAIREMTEELNVKLKDNTKLEVYGTVRDLKSSTKEHLGLVYLAIAEEVTVKEKDTLRGQWMNMSDLVTNYYKFESWARLIVDHLFINYKKSGKLFLTASLTGERNYDRKRKKTVRKNC